MSTLLPDETAKSRIYLFAGLRLIIRQQPQTIPGGKPSTLLAYLLLHPTVTHSRESITDRFWPHADPSRARRYLSDAIYRLQQSLGYDWLEATTDTLRLKQPSPLWVDVWAFTHLAQSSDTASQETAVSLYTDDLLPELYDDWLLPIRVRLREQALILLTRLAKKAWQENRTNQAFTYYHRLTALDPLNEAAHRGLMRLYIHQNHPAAALAQFNHLEALLRTDLDVSPLPETTALAAEVRALYEKQARPATAAPPFTGRRQERAQLLQAVAAAQQGHGSIYLLEGEAGIGKTRLLQAVAEGAAWRGITVGWGQGRELGARTPYLPLDEALREILTGANTDYLNAHLPPETAVTLTTLLATTSPATTAPLDTHPDLNTALATALRTLGKKTPLLLILDDVHWAGDAFWDLLTFAHNLTHTALLLILAYRPATLRATPAAWKALQALDTAAAPQRLVLSGLTLHDAAALAAHIGRPTTNLNQLHQTTAGNPLYLLESLTASSSSDWSPPSLNRLLQMRLERLSPPARDALEMAAVLGRNVTFGIWQAALGHDLTPILPELLNGRFLHETTTGYTFQHDLTREQVYQAIAPDRLQTRHARAAAALQAQKAPPAALAWHYEHAGQYSQAIHNHLLAGEQAIAAFAYAAALAHFDAALALPATAAQPNDLGRLLFARQQVLELIGPVEKWRTAVSDLQTLAANHDNPTLTLAALEARLQIAALDSNLSALQENAAAALALAQELGDTTAEVRVRSVLGWHLMDALARPRSAKEHLTRAANLAAGLRDPRLHLTVLSNLSLAQRLSGQSHQSRHTASQMLALTHLHPSLQRAQALALQALANAAMHEAEWETAWQTLNTAVSRFETLNDLWALGDALFDRILLGTRMGQLAIARQDIERIIREQKAIGIPADSHYRLWSTAYAMLVAVTAADWQTAARCLPLLQNGLNANTEVRVAIQGYTVLGMYHLAQQNMTAALDALAAAVSLWQRGEPSIELSPLFYHAIAAHHTGDSQTAQHSLAQAEAVLQASESRHYLVLWQYVRALLFADPTAHAAAQSELNDQANRIEDPQLRQAFLQNVPLHRQVMAARETAVSTRTTARRQRLRQLLDEAAAQGITLTNDQLAATLGVSRRTIQRDRKALNRSS